MAGAFEGYLEELSLSTMQSLWKDNGVERGATYFVEGDVKKHIAELLIEYMNMCDSFEAVGET